MIKEQFQSVVEGNVHVDETLLASLLALSALYPEVFIAAIPLSIVKFFEVVGQIKKK